MSRHCSSNSVSSPLPDHLDLTILHAAQACLRCLQHNGTPSKAESEAWEWFHQTYEPVLRSYVAACGMAEANQDDCRQDVWLKVIETLPTFVSDGTQSPFCCWLKTIVHNKAMDSLRYQRRHPTQFLRAEVEATLASQDGGPVADYEQDCRQEAVQRALTILRQQVPELTYCILERRCIEGRRTAEIATELGLTRRQVVCRLYHAKQKFRALLEQVLREDLSVDD